MDKKRCKQKDCDRCICSTCMHQGFDCDCGDINPKPIQECEDYDEMQGEQLRLELE